MAVNVDATPKPEPITEADSKNFATLLQAAENGHLCAVSAIRKSDNKQVTLVCAMGYSDKYFYPCPLAVMVEGNPFEEFYDPLEE